MYLLILKADTTASIIAAIGMNLLKLTGSEGPYTAKNSGLVKLHQDILEKGISSIVDFFGGPEAAYRNNIDTSFGSGSMINLYRRRVEIQAAVPTPSPVK